MAAPVRHGLIAGNGQLPVDLAASLEAKGVEPVVIRIEGETDPALARFAGCELSVNRLSYALPELKKAGCAAVTLAGGIRTRPEARNLRVPMMLWPDLPVGLLKLKAGDNAFLSMIVWLLEKHGLKVVGAHEIMPELLVPLGPLDASMAMPSAEDARFAMDAAREIGRMDIGQGVVAMGRRIVAVEGAEGTDQMILRIAELREQGRLSNRPAILAKAVKPGQELRVDLPTIGPETVRNCATSGITTICVSADATLVMEAEKTVRLALDAGIAIIGMDTTSGPVA